MEGHFSDVRGTMEVVTGVSITGIRGHVDQVTATVGGNRGITPYGATAGGKVVVARGGNRGAAMTGYRVSGGGNLGYLYLRKTRSGRPI